MAQAPAPLTINPRAGIYQDGYGPTIQTLEQYLRRQFAGLYHPMSASEARLISQQTAMLKSIVSRKS